MYSSVSMEVQFFLLSAAAGIVTAFIYDLFRIARKLLNCGDIAVSVQDIIFCSAAAVVLFAAAYIKNSGELRWQGFLGAASGIAAYILIVRNRLLNASTIILGFCAKVICTAAKILFFPVRLILRLFRKPVILVAWYTGRGIKKAKNIAACGKFRMKRNFSILLKSAVKRRKPKKRI